MEVIATILGVLAAVAVLSLLAQRINLPYPTVMVLGGLGVSLIPHLPPVPLNPDYVFLLFLPPLLYGAAWEMPWRDFRADLRPILMLAVGFVVFTTFAVAWVIRAVVPDFPWPVAIAFGAIVSPPDAVAATAILGRLGTPHRLRVILEGESLVNDASGLTLFTLAVGMAYAGWFSVGHAAWAAAEMVGGGIVVGLILGWIATWVHSKLDDPMAETVITLLSPYAAFLPAEAIHASGVLATVVMGLYVSRKAPRLFSPGLRVRARAVWDTVTFMLNGLVFVLIGLQLRFVLAHTRGHAWPRLLGLTVLVVAVLVAARMAWVFVAGSVRRWLAFSEDARQRVAPWRQWFLVAYTGMRGVVSLAAALSIPVALASGEPFPHRGLIIILTFAVILVTLVAESLTLPWLIRRLKLTAGDRLPCEERDARQQIVQAALDRLDAIERAGADNVPPGELEIVRGFYQRRAENLAQSDPHDCRPAEAAGLALRRELMNIERQKLLELYDQDAINDQVLSRIETDLDLEQLRWGER